MNNDSSAEKRKYLKRAKQLLQKPARPVKKKLQASVEPFSRQEIIRERCGPVPIERSNSDPTPTVTTCSPPIQRVTPTRRHDHASATELPSPSSPSSLCSRLSEPYTLSDRTVRGVHVTVTDGDARRKVQSTDSEREFSTPSPKYTNTDIHFPSFVEDLNHIHVSTPLLRNSNQHHFPANTAPSQLSAINSRCSELESRLKIQTDINKELKRLLVASMGNDLQHCLNHIAEEKATISQDLDTSLQRLADNYEEIDRVSIECDIWRSKFLASRLMIDELASWKAEETRQLRESQRALQCMLKEHAELRHSLLQCGRHLSELAAHVKLKNGMDDEISHRPAVTAQDNSTVVELAKTISGKARLLHRHVCQMEDWEEGPGKPQARGLGKATAGERLAQQVLTNAPTERHLPSPTRLGNKSLGRGHGLLSPHGPTYLLNSGTGSGILFQCNHCRGKIYNV